MYTNNHIHETRMKGEMTSWATKWSGLKRNSVFFALLVFVAVLCWNVRPKLPHKLVDHPVSLFDHVCGVKVVHFVYSTIHPHPYNVTTLLSLPLGEERFVLRTARGRTSGKCAHRPPLKLIVTENFRLLDIKEETTNFQSLFSPTAWYFLTS